MPATLGFLADYLATAAHLSRPAMAGYVRALRKAAVIPQTRTAQASVDNAVWLLLAVFAGSAQRVREIAETPNSRQTIGETVLNDGDPEITIFVGLRDLINLRRSGGLITHGEFRLAFAGDSITASISAQAASGVLWSFMFGTLVETDRHDFWRFSVARPSLIDGVAALLGPLAASFELPAPWAGMLDFPAIAAAQYQAGTLH